MRCGGVPHPCRVFCDRVGASGHAGTAARAGIATVCVGTGVSPVRAERSSAEIHNERVAQRFSAAIGNRIVLRL